MKYSFVFFLLLNTVCALSQIGINIDTPILNSVFYIDSNRDTPSEVVSDDMVVTTDGLVGLGTDSPESNLDVRGKMRISTGAGKEGKYLFSDADGFGMWGDIIYSLKTISGTVGNDIILYGRPFEAPSSSNSNLIKVSTNPLELSRGRWLVYGRVSVVNGAIPSHGASVHFYDTTNPPMANYISLGASSSYPQMTDPSYGLPFGIVIVEVLTNTPMLVSLFVATSPLGKSSTSSLYGGSQFFALKLSEM